LLNGVENLCMKYDIAADRLEFAVIRSIAVHESYTVCELSPTQYVVIWNVTFTLTIARRTHGLSPSDQVRNVGLKSE